MLTTKPAETPVDTAGTICLFVCGDAMCGRGVDQVLSRPSDQALNRKYEETLYDYYKRPKYWDL